MLKVLSVQLYSLITLLMTLIGRWSGRSNRGKISVSVEFGTQLDVQKYCSAELSADSFVYNLSAVVMHHGRGFGSGHYTSFCWNDEAGASCSCLSIFAVLLLSSIDDNTNCCPPLVSLKNNHNNNNDLYCTLKSEDTEALVGSG